jgi:hypothetical protein
MRVVGMILPKVEVVFAALGAIKFDLHGPAYRWMRGPPKRASGRNGSGTTFLNLGSRGGCVKDGIPCFEVSAPTGEASKAPVPSS